MFFLSASPSPRWLVVHFRVFFHPFHLALSDDSVVDFCLPIQHYDNLTNHAQHFNMWQLYPTIQHPSVHQHPHHWYHQPRLDSSIGPLLHIVSTPLSPFPLDCAEQLKTRLPPSPPPPILVPLPLPHILILSSLFLSIANGLRASKPPKPPTLFIRKLRARRAGAGEWTFLPSLLLPTTAYLLY